MDLPDTLPGRLYLLAYPPDSDRLRYRSDLDLLLRAAALTDLLQRGLLADRDGRPEPDGPAPSRLDPVLVTVLDEVAESRPRRWEHWVRVKGRAIKPAVRDRLGEQGYLDLVEHRVLGLFPTLRPVPREPDVRRRLAAEFEAAFTRPAAEVEPCQAAAVALAAAGEMRTVLSRQRQRAERDRIAELTARTGPVPRALRSAIQGRRAAHSAG
ncbi:GOLPH3/VPS74 family protein [Kitasatospora sp. NBC_01266]|uniref:GOLPH3/VPS74 family protein n=1 Tax=Kitasatospora sp. NBC_01266 TaxID=2903572 RepID=UPI002E30C62F|nr:GPP34 family phosphoprotein [Kitasatospora sp. NBC_01266]